MKIFINLYYGKNILPLTILIYLLLSNEKVLLQPILINQVDQRGH